MFSRSKLFQVYGSITPIKLLYTQLKSRKIPAFFVSLTVRELGIQWAWNKGIIQGREAYSNSYIQVISTGNWNKNGPGPDFTEARLNIDGITWFGSVEIHYKASDWYKHKHHDDPVYSNVILHVVAINDKPIYINGTKLPVLIVSATLNTLLSPFNRIHHYRLPCHFIQRNFSQEYYLTFWEKRMNRKKVTYSPELDAIAWLLGKNSDYIHVKRNARQRNSTQYQTALSTLKSNVNLNHQSTVLPSINELYFLIEKSLLTVHEQHKLLCNGAFPYYWNIDTKDRVLSLAKILTPDNNSIISKFKFLGITPKNAFESQALLEIYRQQCEKRGCLSCEIGSFALHHETTTTETDIFL